jgi:hypothetical protein
MNRACKSIYANLHEQNIHASCIQPLKNNFVRMKKNIVSISLFFLILLIFTRCDEFFETKPDDLLEGDKYIESVNELYSGYMGVASKIQLVADHAIFLSELRGDLLEPTANAPQELWDIYNFNNQNGNSFTDPKGYYDIIINANDYITKAFNYMSKNPNAVDSAIFKPLIGGAIRFKCWSYLMLAKLYGEAVYFDDPMVKYTNLSNFQTLDLDGIIDKCIELMNTGINGINGKQTLQWTEILYPGVATSSQDLTWNMICPSSELLMMELNLWKGNYQDIVDAAIPYIYDNGSKRYKLSNEDYNGEWCQFFYASPVTKTRELINVVPFDYKNNQTNRIISFFSNTYPSKYYLRPTEVAMDRFNNQVQFDGITQTDVYRGNNYTFIQQNGEWVIRKFTRNRETADLIYKNDVHITLYRASDIHLFLIEALNHLGLFQEAQAFLNDGVGAYLSKYAGSLRYPLNNEVYNPSLGTNLGIRRRVNLEPVYPDMELDSLKTIEDSLAYMKEIDELLVEETCMESAGEARSYFAMIRVAKRWNDASILANRVSAKYPIGKQEAVRNHLMDPKNWFVFYDLKK